MVEKPKFEDAPSKNAIIGRYILTPRIFEMIETIKPGAGGELQLTDAIKALLQHEKVYGFSYEGKRHDAGDKLGFLKATVEFALKHPALGADFRTWLKSFPASQSNPQNRLGASPSLCDGLHRPLRWASLSVSPRPA